MAFLLVAPGGALAQSWTIVPSITGEMTFTNNVTLAPWSSPDRKSDWVTQLTPGLAFNERSAHTRFAGTVSVPLLLYARTPDNNDVRPEVNLAGNVELVPRLFFVDATANVSQQFISPFGPRPIDVTNATSNRLTAQSYRISPYFKGDARGDLHYELRDDNQWTTANGVLGGRSYTNEVTGMLARDPRPLGFNVSVDRADTSYSEQTGSFVTQIARFAPVWQPEAQWQLSLIAGYEDDRYPLQTFSGAVYGAGFHWRPTERTNLEASWEHRFFGGSYRFKFDHRTPLSVWSIDASRDITTYPQQLANFLAGGNVNALLNALFVSRVADPLQRQALVQQLIRDRGLPSTLNGPLSLVSQQVTLQENLTATAGILGARNSILFSSFRTRNEPITGEDPALSGLVGAQTNNTQTGANLTWTHNLSPQHTLATTFNWVRTVANDTSGASTRQGTLQSTLTTPLSLLTSVFVGARYQWITSNSQDEVREAAVFVGVSHFFR